MDFHHLVVVKPGALGDTLLLAPALRSVRLARPGMSVTVVGTPPSVELLVLLGVADAVFSFDRLRLYGAVRPGDPGFGAAAVMAFLPGRQEGEGDPFRARGARRVVRAPSRPGAGGPHVAAYLHGALERLLGRLPPPTLEPFVVAPLSRTPVPNPYVAVAPGAGGVGKLLPMARFEAIAADAATRGLHPVFVAGEVEVDRGLLEGFPEAFPRWVCPTLTELAGLLAGARAFYGNDSGPGHLAGLLGTDTTVFFGPTDPDVWRPWGPRVTVERF
jgi:ADP-heptose:LPS heptosyltransferase